MAYQPEVDNYDTGVYQLETTDPVQGGAGGVANAPLLNLANRTNYLYNQLNTLKSSVAGLAPLASPAFTGSPTAPEAPIGDQSLLIANTEFVARAMSGVMSLNVAGAVNVTVPVSVYGAGIIELTGALAGNIAVIFPSQDDHWIVANNTTGAYSVTYKTASGTGIVGAQGYATQIWCDGTNIYKAQSDLANLTLTGGTAISGTLTVPNAAGPNQAVALQQVQNAPPVTGYQNISAPAANATYTLTLSMTAPCNGYACAVSGFQRAAAMPTGVIIGSAVSLNGTAATDTADDNPFSQTEMAQASYTAGQAIVATFTLTCNGGAPTSTIAQSGLLFFLPNP